MSISRQEEIIAALWTIVALLCFLNDMDTAGYIFIGKAILDIFGCIFHAIKEIRT